MNMIYRIALAVVGVTLVAFRFRPVRNFVGGYIPVIQRFLDRYYPMAAEMTREAADRGNVGGRDFEAVT